MVYNNYIKQSAERNQQIKSHEKEAIMKQPPKKLPFYKKLLSDQGFGWFIGLIIAGFVSMCIMGILPSAVTDVAILSTLPFLLMGVGVLYFAFIHSSRPTVMGRILAVVSVVNMVQGVLLPFPRLTMLLSAILLIAHAAYCARYLFLSAYLSYRPALNGWLLLYESLTTVVGVTTYTFMEPTKFLHLWEVPLVLSLLLTGVTVFFLVKGSIELKDDRLSERIALPFLVLLMSFALLTFTAQNLNCALDTSKPTAYTVTVQDKHRSAGKMTRCFLTVTVEGQELDLDVAASDYREAEVGDPVVVEVYEGAFGKAYCVLRELP